MRKNGLISLLFLISVCLLSANGAKESGSNGMNREPVTLKMVIPGFPQKDQPLVNDAVSKYLKDDLNITLDLEQIDWAGFGDKCNLIIAANEEYDLMFTAVWTNYLTNASKGAFTPLEELLEQYGQDIMNASYSWVLDAARVDGVAYAVPTYQMLAQERGFFMRTDLMDKYGFEYKDVYSFEDMEEMCEVILENEPDMTPLFTLASKPYYGLEFIDNVAGTDAVVSNGNEEMGDFFNFFASQMYKDSMDLAREWFLKGYVNKDVATTTTAPVTALKSGKYFAAYAQTNVTEDVWFSKQSGYTVYPATILPPIITTRSVMGAMYSIPLQSKIPERTMMFLNRMHTDEVLVNLLVNGIEGIHYTKNANGLLSPIEGDADPYSNLPWAFGNQALLYPFEGQDPNTPRLLDEFNRNATRSGIFGFSYDPKNVKNELAALSNVVSEFSPALSMGAIDPYENGTYDKFLEKLDAAGVQRLKDDMQAQLDAWKARQ